MKEKVTTKRMLASSMLLLSIISMALLMSIVPTAESQSSGLSKPKEFYFHYLDVPVSVGSVQTKYIMNTTRWFRFLTEQEAFLNSFYKQVGLPKLTVYFYLYPNLAGPVTINGTWQVFIWANSSAQHPVGFSMRFYEIGIAGGTPIWDSGAISPTVMSSGDPDQTDVQIQSYNLSTPLSRSFSPDTTLKVEVEITSGASEDVRVWYDSPLFPSKAILPVEDYAKPVWVKTFAVDNSETNLFHYNWSESNRKVIVRANVTDPFGGYDVYMVNMTILDPAGSPVVDNVNMTRVTDGQWQVSYAHLFEANWTYLTTATLGNYTVNVWVVDNNGYYHSLDCGDFEPFVEEGSHVFTVGIVTYYNPAFLVVDDVNAPLPKAQVYVTWPNGTTDVLPRYTAQNGFINLTHVLAGDYGFTILWKDIVVLQQTQHVDSNGPYTLKCQVYQLTVEVLGNNGVRIQGAYVIIYDEAGVGQGLETTDVAGKAVFRLPAGTYEVDARYSADYWLTVVTSKAVKPSVSVTNSRSETVVLADFPPPIWATTAFWLLMIFVLVGVLAVVFTVFRRRVPVPKVRRKK